MLTTLKELVYHFSNSTYWIAPGLSGGIETVSFPLGQGSYKPEYGKKDERRKNDKKSDNNDKEIVISAFTVIVDWLSGCKLDLSHICKIIGHLLFQQS
jgi:hypothetical protein